MSPRAKTGAATLLRNALRGVGEVLEPEDAEEPILAASVRAAVFGWLREINSGDALKQVGIKPRVSALLSGPPGCGKTTLAHHFAARLGVPLVNVGAEHLFTNSLGGSEANVARLFRAIEAAETPSVLFLDEIDSIGGKRRDTKGDSGGAVGAMNSTLTVLLRKVEQFSGVMIAATNRADTLDSALWRRFSMQIEVALPDGDARWAILKRYGEPFAIGDALLDLLTDLTVGAPPSLLRQVMESIKRDLVLCTGNGWRNPEQAFAAATAAVRPHPDYELPPLWQDARGLQKLSQLPWPPTRKDAS